MYTYTSFMYILGPSRLDRCHPETGPLAVTLSQV